MVTGEIRPAQPRDRRLPRDVFAIVALVALATAAAVISGAVIVGRGDPALRLMISFWVSDDPLGYASRWDAWAGAWPAGHFLIQGSWLRVLRAVGIESVASAAQATILLSLIAWTATAGFLYLLISRVRDSLWGWLAVAGFVSLPLLTELAHNIYPEMYFLGAFLLALHAVVRFEETRKRRWVVLSALVLLGASTFRTEAIVLAAGWGAVLAWRHGILTAVGFLTLATPLTIARVLLSPALVLDQVPQGWVGRLGDFSSLLLYFSIPNLIVLLLLCRAFRCRRTEINGESPRVTTAVYAAAGAGLLILFFFLAMIFLGGMGPDSRFLAVPLLGCLVTLTCLGTRPPAETWSTIRLRVVLWVTLSSGLQLGTLGIDYLTDPARPPQEVREALEWLGEHAEPGQRIVVDHLNWWEWTVLLYGVDDRHSLETSYINYQDRLDPDAAPESPPPQVAEYLRKERPTLVVRAAGELVRGRDATRWGGPWTFLDSWSPPGSEGASEEWPTSTMQFRNESVRIYSLEW